MLAARPRRPAARSPRLRGAALAAALVAAWTTAGRAAAPDGTFAVKGAGQASCERFVAEHDSRTTPYRLFGGWIDGYLTAYNELTGDTFDVTPWQGTDTLAAAIASYCREHPRQPFYAVVIRLVRALREGRLERPSTAVRAEAGDRAVVLYRDVLERVQGALKTAGFYHGPVDGRFGEAIRTALEHYQRERGLPATGLPDQRTLLSLLRAGPPR